MITDAIAAELLSPGALTAGGASPGAAEKFQQAYSQAVARLNDAEGSGTHVEVRFGSAQPASPTASDVPAILDPLLNLNADSTRLAAHAGQAQQAELKPSELMMLTMRSHEFLFHCELVANVANRSSDGVQQLFRQQS